MTTGRPPVFFAAPAPWEALGSALAARGRVGEVYGLLGGRPTYNWFGQWPPGGITDKGGKPLAEERRPRP